MYPALNQFEQTSSAGASPLPLQALESPGHNDDTQWLTYWLVFGSFNFLESFAFRIVLYYRPWYFVFKTVLILWLQLPVTMLPRVVNLSVNNATLSVPIFSYSAHS